MVDPITPPPQCPCPDCGWDLSGDESPFWWRADGTGKPPWEGETVLHERPRCMNCGCDFIVELRQARKGIAELEAECDKFADRLAMGFLAFHGFSDPQPAIAEVEERIAVIKAGFLAYREAFEEPVRDLPRPLADAIRAATKLCGEGERDGG